MEETLAVCICATQNYQYAMEAQARMVHANLHRLKHKIVLILVGDEGMKKIAELYTSLFGERLKIERIAGFKELGAENYKNEAQLLIAQMRTAAFARGRQVGATFCWSLDSDVIPKTSACYATLRWLLDIPGAYYEVAIAPYPSQGGGDFLTGRGAPENPIFEDFKLEERKVPAELLARKEANDAKLRATPPGHPPAEADVMESQEIRKAVQACDPVGNVFEVNGKMGWRARGWMSAAYPALGRGAFVPSDWSGFGCTLMSARALDECDFLGYDGGGTEDLFVNYQRWQQVGIRIVSAIHEPAYHVSRRKADGKYFLSWVRWVTEFDQGKGECVGHLRTFNKPWYGHSAGEKFDKDNDGHPMTRAQREAALAAAKPAPAPEPRAETPAEAEETAELLERVAADAEETAVAARQKAEDLKRQPTPCTITTTLNALTGGTTTSSFSTVLPDASRTAGGGP